MDTCSPRSFGRTPLSADALRLFFLGFLTLFLELILIRFIAGNVWNSGYFTHLVLIASFLGIGTGFLFHRSWSLPASHVLFMLSAILLSVLAILLTTFHPAMPGFDSLTGYVGEEFFPTRIPQGRSSLWPLLSLILWFTAIAAIFALLSQRTAKIFARFRPLHAYTLDIAGSCAGILMFMILSGLQVRSGVWFLLLIPLYLLTIPHRRATIVLGICTALAAASSVSFWADVRSPFFTQDLDVTVATVWSPYQKVQYATIPSYGDMLLVNDMPWQDAENDRSLTYNFYSAIYRDRAQRGLPPYKRVLVLGSGMGNDVRTALLWNAEHVEAVEIDPAIVQLGRERHPGKPYDDPRVRVTVDDGRAVLARTEEHYDLIIFALTESLFRFSPFGQLRVENYLYTVEAMELAHSRLTPEGDLLFYNYYKSPWLTEKIGTMVAAATGDAPRLLGTDAGFTVLAAGIHNRGEKARSAVSGTTPATDDWPFYYLRTRNLPLPYAAAMAGMSAFLLAFLFWTERTSRERTAPAAPLQTKAAFFLLGVAFLLLETKSIVQFSLLFGTTWVNQSLVFLAILLLVLAANWTALFLKRSTWIIICGLLAVSCVLALTVPLSTLLSLESDALRFLGGSFLILLPVFFANLLFSIFFRDQQIADEIFGWNLLGGAAGGIVEYTSMLTGYRFLALLVLLLYTGAALLFFLQQRRAHPSPSAIF